MNRRRVVGGLAAAGFTAPVITSLLASTARAQEASPAASPVHNEILAELGKDQSLIERGTTTFEMPMDGYDQFITPNELFFVRSNGPVMVDIDSTEWRLNVTGHVDNEMEFSLDDLKGMETRTLTAWLECSGNSRGRFTGEPEPVEGTSWGNGAIGNVEWTGVSLIDVLDKAGIKDGAVDVVSQGGDFDEMQRGLPVEIAHNPDVMIVWQMNGEDLPKPNGGPVRLLVPGWGGIASTKWLVGLNVMDEPFQGHFNVESYVVTDETGTILRPVREMPVKSVITIPATSSETSSGAETVTGIAEPEAVTEIQSGKQVISGFAWSGFGGITKVEVSTDSGSDWEEATITDEAGPYSWVRFEYEWDAIPGEHVLSSRATDDRGLQQPLTVPWNARGYGMNAIFEVPVRVTE